MKKALFLSLLLIPASLRAAGAETFKLSRWFTMKACNGEAKCMGPIAEDKDKAAQTLTLEPFKKGGKEGWHAYDRNELVENGITFKSEIHVIKWKKPGKYKYYIYAMLRSGNREGKVLMQDLKSLKSFKEKTLTDKPVPIVGGTLQAQLVLGPQ